MRRRWRRLPAAHRRWILLKALLGTAVINLVVNAAIAWLGVRGQDVVSFWGAPLVRTSIFWNLVGTLFLLPLITCLLTTTAIRHDVRRGALAPLPADLAPALGPGLPSTRLGRGCALGACAVAALAPPLVLALILLGVSELSRGSFIVCQTAFAVVLGCLVTPPIALRAMADPPAGAPG